MFINTSKQKTFLLFAISFFLLGFQILPTKSQNKNIKDDKQSLKRIGVQVYTVRKEMEQDFEGTLRRVSEIGYDEVEFAGLFWTRTGRSA